MSQQDKIVAHFFALPDSEQEVVFRSCLGLLEPRYQQQVFDLLTKPFPFGFARRGEGADAANTVKNDAEAPRDSHNRNGESAPSEAKFDSQSLPAPVGATAAALCPGVDTMPAANCQATRAGASPEATPGAGRLGNTAGLVPTPSTARPKQPEGNAVARGKYVGGDVAVCRGLASGDVSRDYFSLDEIAAKLGVSRRTIEREIAARRFPRPFKIRGRSMIRSGDLRTYEWRLTKAPMIRAGDQRRKLRSTGERVDYGKGFTAPEIKRLREGLRAQAAAGRDKSHPVATELD